MLCIAHFAFFGTFFFVLSFFFIIILLYSFIECESKRVLVQRAETKFVLRQWQQHRDLVYNATWQKLAGQVGSLRWFGLHTVRFSFFIYLFIFFFFYFSFLFLFFYFLFFKISRFNILFLAYTFSSYPCVLCGVVFMLPVTKLSAGRCTATIVAIGWTLK